MENRVKILIARVIAIELHLLWIEIVQLVDQHDIAFTLAVLEIRRGVAADVDHARSFPPDCLRRMCF